MKKKKINKAGQGREVWEEGRRDKGREETRYEDRGADIP